MDNLKNEIRNIFTINAKITNETTHYLDNFIKHTHTFKNILPHSFEQNLRNEISSGDISLNSIYNTLESLKFKDFDFVVDITITDKINYKNIGYSIYLNSRIIECLEGIRTIDHMSTTNSHAEIQNFFKSELEGIKKNEFLRYKIAIDDLKEKIIKPRFSLFKKVNPYEIKIGHIYFLLEEYKNAKEFLCKDKDSRELVTYCQIMMDQDFDIQLQQSFSDKLMETRKKYFDLRILKMKGYGFMEIYKFMSSFDCDIPLVKCIFEIELCSLLLENNKFVKRLPFSLFVCMNVLYENGLYRTCIECIADYKNNKDVNKIKEQGINGYVDDLLLKCMAQLKEI